MTPEGEHTKARGAQSIRLHDDTLGDVAAFQAVALVVARPNVDVRCRNDSDNGDDNHDASRCKLQWIDAIGVQSLEL